MDSTITVALIGTGGLVFTSLIGAYVAIRTNKGEKKKVAETALEKAESQIEERIEKLHQKELRFKDSQLSALRKQIEKLEEDNGTLKAENIALRLQLRKPLNDPLKDDMS